MKKDKNCTVDINIGTEEKPYILKEYKNLYRGILAYAYFIILFFTVILICKITGILSIILDLVILLQLLFVFILLLTKKLVWNIYFSFLAQVAFSTEFCIFANGYFKKSIGKNITPYFIGYIFLFLIFYIYFHKQWYVYIEKYIKIIKKKKIFLYTF